MPTEARTTSTRTARWGRVAVVVVLSVAGALGVVACALAWLFMGFMGTAVGPWEPVAYPVGAVLCVLVPVLVARRLLGRHGGGARWGVAAGVVTVVAAALVAASVLGVAA